MSTLTFQRRPLARRSRRGISTLWLILFMPVALIGLLMTIETGRLWLARMEVEDALESAVLAAVIEWGEHNEQAPHSTLPARQVAADFAESNTVLGAPFSLGDASLNHNPGVGQNPGMGQGHNNQNASADGVLVFGAITQIQPTVIFNPQANPHDEHHYYAVLGQASFQIPSQYNFGGFALGPYAISAQTVAVIDEEGRARVIRVDSIASP